MLIISHTLYRRNGANELQALWKIANTFRGRRNASTGSP